MDNAAVRVGDHDAEPTISPRRAAELFAMRNCEWSLEDYRALSDRFADAVQALQISLTSEDFAAARAAALTLHEIAHQTAGLNLGIKHAIAKVEQGAQS